MHRKCCAQYRRATLPWIFVCHENVGNIPFTTFWKSASSLVDGAASVPLGAHSKAAWDPLSLLFFAAGVPPEPLGTQGEGAWDPLNLCFFAKAALTPLFFCFAEAALDPLGFFLCLAI